MKNIAFLLALCTVLLHCDKPSPQRVTVAITPPQALQQPRTEAKQTTMSKIIKSEEEWKKELSPDQYRILRKKGTEYAFTGKYYRDNSEGVYTCGACGNPLFTSDTKYDSGCGWPSFYEPLNEQTIALHEDTSFGMIRTEVVCARCDSHLGHVFDDGPKPTGLRYCINSLSLNKVPKSE